MTWHDINDINEMTLMKPLMLTLNRFHKLIYSDFSIDDLEQINAGWVIAVWKTELHVF